ncbi:neuronal pentraxin-2 [Myripristis murdjan]|uniref:neuronal pentraxin-2 n=1 Tax=Myripristis murdjan TaxID=586833 RepID=UPI001175CF64|nr:neuronal pentraxin-2-like [Myripristis murdjan]
MNMGITFASPGIKLFEPKPSSLLLSAELWTESMRNSQSLHLSTSLIRLVFFILSLPLCPASATSGSDHNYVTHPRFVCTPIPVDADPACFPPTGPGMGGSGPSGPGHQSTLGGPPSGWWGVTDEAKATILHLRESLVQQKETILDQRETIRELTAKLTLCEGFGQGMTAHDDQHGTASRPRHGGAASPHMYTDTGRHSNQQGHHGNSNLIPDSPHYPSMGGHRSDGGHSNSNQVKDKHITPGDITSSPEQMERMLQALKKRLDNLQKRNTSTSYSSSLTELLQRNINTLEQQLHHHTAALSSPDHHDDQSSPDDHHNDTHPKDHDGSLDGHDDGHHSNGNHSDNHGGANDDDDHHDAEPDHDGSLDVDHHGNEADSQGYLLRTGYRPPGSYSGFHPNKLDTLLSQLHFTGSSGKKTKSPEAFQIGFPMRTNYMYGRVKTTLLHEIFALTLCLWIKAGVGPGMGTPFSYSVPGQANELVLIEWGNNPMELLIDDKAVTLPLSLSDGKWHHMCVTWSTRDGQWEVFQDGVQRGSGENLSAWHPVRPGGVFILGQEQDALGGRFDATQSFVGEISDLNMWSHVLPARDIYSLSSCSSHLNGDVIAWSETEVELHGGVTKYPFDPCS